MRKDDPSDLIRVQHVRNSKYGKKHNKLVRGRIKRKLKKEQEML